jgi:hypothetical protein
MMVECRVVALCAFADSYAERSLRARRRQAMTQSATGIATEAMTQVVVMEVDAQLRDALRELLTLFDHCTVTEISEETAGAEYLAAMPGGAVVVVSNRDPDHHRTAEFFATVAADEQLATRHRYILLSTNPGQIRETMRAHLAQLNVPVLAKPFDVEALLTAVRVAETRLVPVPVTARDIQRDA